MKAVFTIISSIVVGMVLANFGQDLKEEKLIYTLTEPATFGDITFQNIEIRNDGFDPATNVILSIPKKTVDSKKIEFVAKFDLKGDGKSIIGGLERIRRGERVLVSLTSKAGAASTIDISIKSDRSIADFALSNIWIFDIRSFFIGTASGLLLLILFVILFISIPAYKKYMKIAQDVKQGKI